MAGRSPARFLAPLALVAFAVALFVIVTSTSGGGEGGAGTPASDTSRPEATATPATDGADRPRRRVYIVKPGDTPSGIAEKTGVTLEQLEEANPDLDPQLLAPGQRIRLPR
jgi:LysM repeat protein